MRGYSAVVAYGREAEKWGSYLKYKFGEFVFGTGVKFGDFKPPTNFFSALPVTDVSMEEMEDRMDTLTVAERHKTGLRNKTTAGSFTCEFTYKGLEVLLLCALGHEERGSVQADSTYTGFYNHTFEFEPDVRTRPWAFGEFVFGDGLKFGTLKVRRLFLHVSCEEYNYTYISNLLKSLTISGRAGESLKVDVSTEGWRREELNANLSGAPSFGERALFPDVKLTVGTQQVSISSFSLRIERSFERRQTNDLYINEPRVRDWNVSLTFTTREKLPKEETYAILEIDSGQGHKYTFYLPRLIPQPTNPAISAGMIQYEYSYKAIKPDTYPSSFPVPPSGERREVYAVVRNQESRTYWEV